MVQATGGPLGAKKAGDGSPKTWYYFNRAADGKYGANHADPDQARLHRDVFERAVKPHLDTLPHHHAAPAEYDGVTNPNTYIVNGKPNARIPGNPYAAPAAPAPVVQLKKSGARWVVWLHNDTTPYNATDVVRSEGPTGGDSYQLEDGRVVDANDCRRVYMLSTTDRVGPNGNTADTGSDLAKGERGDWQKEGYSLHHTNDQGFHTIEAKAADGQDAGIYTYLESKKYGTLKPNYAGTHEAHQRKGLASAAHALIQQKTGKTLEHTDEQSEDAKKLWAQPARPFGKSAGWMVKVKGHPDYLPLEDIHAPELGADDQSNHYIVAGRRIHQSQVEDMKPAAKELAKGSAQRRMPFNPDTVPVGQRKPTESWTMGDGERDEVPRLEGHARQRGLMKLHSLTESRRNPHTGEREFLLHRGRTANDIILGGGAFGGGHLSSFTPDPKKAESFNTEAINDIAENWEETTDKDSPVRDGLSSDQLNNRKLLRQQYGHIFSSWVPESQIHHIPNAWGSKLEMNPNNKTWKYDPSIPTGKQYRHDEHEVIVNTPKLRYEKVPVSEVGTLVERHNRHRAAVAGKVQTPATAAADKLKAKQQNSAGAAAIQAKWTKPLEKGAARRLAPMNVQEGETPETKEARQWTSGSKQDVREQLPRHEGAIRFRALNKLAAATKTRKHPMTGELEFLMHRGMGHEESTRQLTGQMDSKTSWTPDRNVAKRFGRDADEGADSQGGFVHSAWIPAKHMHNFPFMNAHDPNIRLFREEFEAIVDPHYVAGNLVDRKDWHAVPHQGNSLTGGGYKNIRSAHAMGGKVAARKKMAEQMTPIIPNNPTGKKPPKAQTKQKLKIKITSTKDSVADEGDGLTALFAEHDKKMGKSDLEKGAAARLAPYNPMRDVSPESVKSTEKWVNPGEFKSGPQKGNNKPASKPARERLPVMEGNERKRGLMKLAAKTKVRVNANGEREYLLHRGMAGKEAALHDKGAVKARTSWTPSYQTAKQFKHTAALEGDESLGSEIRSSWIPESAIAHMPFLHGHSGTVRQYSHEEEVVLHPHSSKIAADFVPPKRYIYGNKGGLLLGLKPQDAREKIRANLGKSLANTLEVLKKNIDSSFFLKDGEAHTPRNPHLIKTEVREIQTHGRLFATIIIDTSALNAAMAASNLQAISEQSALLGVGKRLIEAWTKGSEADIFLDFTNRICLTLPDFLADDLNELALLYKARTGITLTYGLGASPSESNPQKRIPLKKSEQSADKKYVASVAVIDPTTGNILMGQRRDNGKWTLPGGGMEPGEAPEAAARRELWEEAGVKGDVAPLGAQTVNTPYRQVEVHAFVMYGKPEATSIHDPDQEVAKWVWVPKRETLPADVLNNLHSPKNVVLKLIGYQHWE